MKLADALPGSLELFEADLLKEGSFDAAVKGAKYVMHTASPFVSSWENPKWVVDTAVNGTKNLLNSVAKGKTIKRVVLTSSCAGDPLCFVQMRSWSCCTAEPGSALQNLPDSCCMVNHNS